MVVGLALLLVSSPQVAGWLIWLRRRFPTLDRRLRRIEPHLPIRLRWALARTRAEVLPGKRVAPPARSG